MKIGFASDHAGFEYKDKLIALMKKKGFETVDFGTYSSESCDYPDFAHRLGNAMDNKEVDLGIALCIRASAPRFAGSARSPALQRLTTMPTCSRCRQGSSPTLWRPASSTPGFPLNMKVAATRRESTRFRFARTVWTSRR